MESAPPAISLPLPRGKALGRESACSLARAMSDAAAQLPPYMSCVVPSQAAPSRLTLSRKFLALCAVCEVKWRRCHDAVPHRPGNSPMVAAEAGTKVAATTSAGRRRRTTAGAAPPVRHVYGAYGGAARRRASRLATRGLMTANLSSRVRNSCQRWWRYSIGIPAALFSEF